MGTRPPQRLAGKLDEALKLMPNGGRITDKLDFLNTHSTRSRTAQGVDSGMPPGHQGRVIDMFTGQVIQ